jgi:hypothetical protein
MPLLMQKLALPKFGKKENTQVPNLQNTQVLTHVAYYLPATISIVAHSIPSLRSSHAIYWRFPAPKRRSSNIIETKEAREPRYIHLNLCCTLFTPQNTYCSSRCFPLQGFHPIYCGLEALQNRFLKCYWKERAQRNVV